MTSLQNLPEIIVLCQKKPDITALEEAISTHWPEFLQNPPVKITPLHGRLSTVPKTTKFQLIVSPANSYGRLDGAFDDAITLALCHPPKHEYSAMTRAAQKVLYEKYRGFAPPGTCTLVRIPEELDDENPWGCKWVAICPTMRIPCNAVWDREVVYECVWSLLCEVEGWNRNRNGNGNGNNERSIASKEGKITRILMTPLATGIGKVSKERWAAQFVLALKHFVDALERPERWSSLEWIDILENEATEVEKTWSNGR